jgi:peptidyl-dipeptidase Dcp
VTSRCQLLPPTEGTNVSCGFGHIFGGGYASGYYSYKWAEALDADAFELFRERGIFDSEVARRFEEFILSKGGSDHPMRLYEQFRGRAPDPNALLRRDGLL